MTSKALRTADALVQSQPELVHSVDIFGETPLDNAVKSKYDVGVALLKRVGGLSGGDPQMADLANETLVWYQRECEKRQASVLKEAVRQLPEQKVSDELYAVEGGLRQFMQVMSLQGPYHDMP